MSIDQVLSHNRARPDLELRKLTLSHSPLEPWQSSIWLQKWFLLLSDNGYLLVYITHLAMSWNGRHTITIFMCEVNHVRWFWQPEKWLQATAVTHLDLFVVCDSLLVENWHECNNKYWRWWRGLHYLDNSLSPMISMLVSATHATTRNHCVSIQVYSQVHVLFYCLADCSIQGGSHQIIIKLSLHS